MASIAAPTALAAPLSGPAGAHRLPATLTSNALEQSRTAMAAAKNLDWTGNAATLCARTLDRDTRLAASIDDRVRQTGQLAWSGGSS